MTSPDGDARIVTWSDGAESRPLTRVRFDDRFVDEGRLQRLLDQNPALVPSERGLVSLGREVGTPAGPIDNLFVDTNGRLTIVEVKLWRNPEARRKVVAQILDYTACVSKWSYSELESKVQNSGVDERTLWQRVLDSTLMADSAEAESAFVDAVSGNLRRGSFELLIVGDGIRSDVESLTGLIGGRPNLEFHLELVQLRLYRLGEDELLVVPQRVAATREVTRAVVEVVTHGDQIHVNVEAPSIAPVGGASGRSAAGGSNTTHSLDDLMAKSTALGVTEDKIAAARSFVDRWVGRGFLLSIADVSLSLAVPTERTASGSAAALRLFDSLEFWLRWQRLVDLDVATNDEAQGALGKHGFASSTHASWRSIDWSNGSDIERLDSYMAWVLLAASEADEAGLLI